MYEIQGKRYPAVSGVYAIYRCDGDLPVVAYIGSTTRSITERLHTHIRELEKGEHGNSHLQAAWNKYGSGVFRFELLQIVEDIDDIFNVEQTWLDLHRMYMPVYNIVMWVEAPPMLGRTHTEEVRQFLREKYTGQKRPREVVERIRQKLIGRVISAKAIEQIRLANQRPYPAFRNTVTGEVIPAGVGLKEICKQRGLNYRCMSGVRTRGKLSYKNWVLASMSDEEVQERRRRKGRKHPAFVNIETEETIPEGQNLAKTAREYNVPYYVLNQLKTQHHRVKIFHNWRLA